MPFKPCAEKLQFRSDQCHAPAASLMSSCMRPQLLRGRARVFHLHCARACDLPGQKHACFTGAAAGRFSLALGRGEVGNTGTPQLGCNRGMVVPKCLGKAAIKTKNREKRGKKSGKTEHMSVLCYGSLQWLAEVPPAVHYCSAQVYMVDRMPLSDSKNTKSHLHMS